MDGYQFDGLLRQINQARSRRGAVLGILGGAVGLLGLTEAEAKHKKKKKKKGSSPPPPPGARCPASCPPCQQCVDGQSCTPRADGIACGDNDCKTCLSGACVNKPDETVCNSGIGHCGRGICNAPVSCTPWGNPCAATSPACCGGSCVIPAGQVVGTCLGPQGRQRIIVSGRYRLPIRRLRRLPLHIGRQCDTNTRAMTG